MRLLDKAGHFVLLIYEKSALKTLVLISVSSVVEWLMDDVFPPAAVPTGLGSSPLRLSEAVADVLYKSRNTVGCCDKLPRGDVIYGRWSPAWFCF